MLSCPTCQEKLADGIALRRHKSELHSDVKAFRDAEGNLVSGRKKDSDLGFMCPSPGCQFHHLRRTPFVKHARTHGYTPVGGTSDVEPLVGEAEVGPLISAINENDLSVSTASLETDIVLSPGDVTKVFQIGDVVGEAEVESLVGNSADGVALDPGTSYLMSTPVLDKLGYFFHSLLRVLICKECEFCVTPSDAPGHAMNFHGVEKKSYDHDEFLRTCADNAIYPTKTVPMPKPSGPPVENIKIVDGYTCLPCGYSSGAKSTMEKHQRQSHSSSKGDNNTANVKVQSLFVSFGIHYFQVDPALCQLQPYTVASIIERYIHSLPKIPPPGAVETERERSVLLSMTNWDTHMEDFRTNPVLHARLKLLKTTDGPNTAGLSAVCLDYLKKGRFICDQSQQGFTIRKHIMQGPTITDQGTRSSYWTAHADNDTLLAYSRLLAHFVDVTLRCMLGDHSGYKIPLTEKQTECASELLLEMRTYRSDVTDDIYDAFHNFVWSLLLPQKNPLISNSPFYCYFALMSLKDDGTYIIPDVVTGWLAKFKYVCRNAAILEAHSNRLFFEDGAVGSIKAAYEDVLALGKLTAFNYFHETQQFVSSIVYNQPRPPQVCWDPDFQKLTVKGETLVLDKLRSGIQDMLRDAWDVYDEITGGKRFAVNIPENLRDVLDNKTRGYSFMDDNHLTETPHEFLSFMVENWKLATVDSAGRVSWNVPQIQRFFVKMAKFNQLLSVLCYILPTIANRVTQFIDVKIRNDIRARNLHVVHNEMFFLTAYHKMTNQSGLDTCMPAFVPKQLQTLLLEYLGGCRPTEQMLSRIAHGEQGDGYYFTYLWVRHGKRTTEEEFGSYFGTTCKQYFDARLTPRPYRQAAIAISREFIQKQHQIQDADNILDLATGHGTQMARTHYGIVENDLPYLTPDAMWEYRALCTEHHCVLGVGPRPPPQPIRLSTSIFSGPALEDAISAAVAKIADKLVEDVIPMLVDRVLEPLQGRGTSLEDDMATSPLPAPSGYLSSPVGFGEESEPTPRLGPRARKRPFTTISSSADVSRGPKMRRAFPLKVPSLPSSSPSIIEISDASQAEATSSSFQASSSSYDSFLVTGSDSEDFIDLSNDQPVSSLVKRMATRSSGNKQRIGQWHQIPILASPPDSSPLPESSLVKRKATRSSRLEGDSRVSRNKQRIGDSYQIPILASPPDSSPITPVESIYEDLARRAIRRALGSDGAKEKSPEQLEAIAECLRCDRDLCVVIPTGGGKSLIWEAVGLETKDVAIIVVPFKQLLEQHMESSRRKGIVSGQWLQSRRDNLPSGVQHIFIQPESGRSPSFKQFLASAVGRTVKRVYIDEAQDFIIGHPDRVPVYEGFAGITALLKFPRIYLTGTLPPQLLKQFCRKTESPDNIHVIRASTDRPELGYNAILLDPQNSGINIVTSAYTLAVALRTLLKTHEKILVFFETVENVEYFCSKDQRTTAKYHARMSEPLKKDSLNKWDAGSMKILAATTAVAYGLDRPDVRFVIACGIGHGMITLVQELGRGGRDGKFAHTFTMDDQSISYISSKQDETLRSAASAFLHSTSICKRQLILAVMDGFSHTCLEDKFCNPCDICYPNSIMKRFAMEAVVDNKIPAPARVPTHPFDLSPLPSISSQSSSCISSSGSFMFSAEMAEELDRVESRLIAQKGKGKEREREDASDPIEISVSPDGWYKIIPTDPTPSTSHGGRHYHSLPPLPAKQPITIPPTSFSQRLPPANGVEKRVEIAESHRLNRLRKTRLLDSYMPLFVGKCPLDFVRKGELLSHPPYVGCGVDFPDKWMEFKKKFRFTSYSYCFGCWLPQDKCRNGEGVACHQGVPFGRSCPFADFIAIAVYGIWNHQETRAEMLNHFSLLETMSTEEFNAWARTEDTLSGEYVKALEVFIWFCERWERRDQ